MAILVAGYLRVSTDEQAEYGVSLPSQESRIIAYCQSQGWILHDLYIDDGYSGKNLNRPAMQQLIANAKEQKIDAVIVIKLDRLSRRQKDVLYLLEDIFEPNKVGFKSVSEPFDTTTPFGKAAIGMMAVFAQLERETIVERVREGKKEAAKQGRFMGGPIALGYKFNHHSKQLEINDIEAETIRFIFSEYLTSGKGYQHIANCLNERHTPTPSTAKEWLRSTVRAILRNAFYAGLVEHLGKMNKGKHPAIITEEEYYHAQQLKKVRSCYNPNSESGFLTGIIYCGECGARMRMKKVWRNPRKPILPKIGYYTCYSQDRSSKSMIRDINCTCGYKRAPEIDRMVIEHLHEYQQHPELLKTTITKLLHTATNKSVINAQLQAKKELKQLKKKSAKWYDVFENDLISAMDLSARIKSLHDQQLYLESKLLTYNDTITLNNSKKATVADVLAILQHFHELWENATFEEQRQLLLSFVQRVTITKNNTITIEFC